MEEIEMKNDIITASELENIEIQKSRYLTTGCAILDNLVLRGGLPVRGITELYGESGVGKTQFCLQIALTVQYPKYVGGFESGAVYICTEGPFPIKRFQELSKKISAALNIKDHNFSDNIFIEHITEYNQLNICLNTKLPQLLRKRKIGLLVIDSIAGIFRYEYEKNQLIERAKDMQLISHRLHQLADQNNIAIVCTNQVTDQVLEDIDNEPLNHAYNPSLGLAWSNSVTSRFKLSNTENTVVINNISTKIKKFSVLTSSELPSDKEAYFIITKSGIVDYKLG